MPSEVLTPAEVASILKVSRRKVYELIAAGDLISARLGAGPKPPIRVRRVDLEAFLRTQSADHGTSRADQLRRSIAALQAELAVLAGGR